MFKMKVLFLISEVVSMSWSKALLGEYNQGKLVFKLLELVNKLLKINYF